MKHKTLIFDLDGTLLDSNDLHRASFEWAIQQQYKNFKLDVETEQRIEGIPTLSKVLYLNELGYNIDSDLVYKHKQEHTELHMHMISWHPGIPKMLNKLSEEYNMAIASNARSAFVYSAINLMKISKFESILTAQFLKGRTKPDPYAYNYTMELLNSDPETTVIIEDSAVGIQAARDSMAKTVIPVKDIYETYDYLESLL